jgi:hypothetical protein
MLLGTLTMNMFIDNASSLQILMFQEFLMTYWGFDLDHIYYLHFYPKYLKHSPNVIPTWVRLNPKTFF